MLSGINRLGMALVLVSAGCTFPDVFVGDIIGVFRRYFDVSMGEMVGTFLGPTEVVRILLLDLCIQSEIGGFDLPFLELLAMWVVLYTTNHEIGQMTELMS